MSIYEYIIGGILILSSLLIIFVVLLQEGRQANVGVISGAADSFLDKGAARTLDQKLAKWTKFIAIAFFVLVLAGMLVTNPIPEEYSMDKAVIDKAINEAVAEVDSTEMSQEELKKAMGDFLTKERGQSMILGYRVACTTIMQLISGWRKPNCSHREYERIFKKVEEFCSKALKQDEKEAAETVQN